jgi:hypothetical protein
MKSESRVMRRSGHWVLAACLVLGCVVVPVTRAEAGTIQFHAWTLDRGNVVARYNPDIYADYRDKFPELVLMDGGESPCVIEFDIDFPVGGTYTVHLHYGSPEPRPMEVWLDKKRVGTCEIKMTGNKPPYPDRHPRHNRPRDEEGFHGLEWHEAIKLTATRGKHTLKFTRQGPPPRIRDVKLTTEAAFPKDWKPAGRKPNVARVEPRCRTIFLPNGAVDPESLRIAIENRIERFGPEYPKGPEYLKRLAAMEAKQAAADKASPEELQVTHDALTALRQESMLAHPALKFDKLLFLRQPHLGASIYTWHRTGGARNPDADLCVLSPVAPNGKVTRLVPELKGGAFGRFDLSFDATRIVFCYSKAGNYRIYEIEIDPEKGKMVPDSLRQLTFDVDPQEDLKRYGEDRGKCRGDGYQDIDPIYLPDGKIMFASSRSRRAVLCAPQTSTTLHVMDADGKNMRCISAGQVNELAPCLLDDGRIAYTRWEYIDKGFGNAQSLWAVRPDGSGSDHVHKNMLVRPGAMLHVRNVPGTRKLVSVGAGHHGGHEGPIILIDSRANRRNAQGLTNLTPEVSYPGLFPMRGKGGKKFREPHPLSETFYLVSHNGSGPYSIYMMDAWGNRAPLYQHEKLSSLQPMPLRPRPRPTNIPPVDRTAAKPGATATMFMSDVYQGMKGIKRGQVKYVRVMEARTLSWYDSARAGRQGDGAGMEASAVSGGGDVSIKVVHGIADVKPDGSAFFSVPAETNVFLQALDENYMELQRMRTFLNLMPGEKRSCIGCHELRMKAPNLTVPRPAAAAGPVQALRPQPGDKGVRAVHYESDIQPILDRRCIRCHGEKDPKGKLTLVGTRNEKFNVSYDTLKRKALVSYLQGGFGSANLPAEPPKTFGSHQSKMVEMIRKDPCKGDLTREEFIKIVTWIDACAPYYGTHRGYKNLKWKDKPDFRPAPLAAK